MDWQLINDNLKADVNRLRLAHHGDSRWTDAILQIDCRQRVASKLPETLARFPQFTFPSTLSAAQSTDDRIAAFHASMISANQRVLDMTCGMGIDAWHIALRGASVMACEMEPDTARCAADNYATFDNIQIRCCDSTQLLRELPDDSFDSIFIDPARRGDHGQRLFALSDCQPDVVSLMPEMLRVAPRVIIKASPMLDATQTMRQLPEAVAIQAVGTPTECKELLIECRRPSTKPYTPLFAATTILADGQQSTIESATNNPPIVYGEPTVGQYIYEPYPSIIKMGLSADICRLFPVKKIAPSTHLFISPEIVADFPGRRMQIEAVSTMNKREVRDLIKRFPAMDITTRNFPLTPPQLSARLKIKPGNQHKLIACRDSVDNNLLIVAKH